MLPGIGTHEHNCLSPFQDVSNDAGVHQQPFWKLNCHSLGVGLSQPPYCFVYLNQDASARQSHACNNKLLLVFILPTLLDKPNYLKAVVGRQNCDSRFQGVVQQNLVRHLCHNNGAAQMKMVLLLGSLTNSCSPAVV